MVETIEVNTMQVACDGGNGPLGHPRVYLHLDHDKGDRSVCPYCSRTYVLKQSPRHTAA